MSRNLLLKRCLAFTDFTSFKDISLCAVRESVNTKIKKCPKPITKPVQSKNWSPVFKYLKTENIPKIVHMIEDVRVSRFCFLASSTIIILSLSNEISPFISLNFYIVTDFIMDANVLQLPEAGDFEALNSQPRTTFNRSTKLDLTTDPPLLGRCCYRLFLLSFW